MNHEYRSTPGGGSITGFAIVALIAAVAFFTSPGLFDGVLSFFAGMIG